MSALTIGAVAAETGSNVQTIRYYEQIGLLPPAERTEGNQRRYGHEHVARLAFIRHSRELGFPLEAIRELLSLSDTPDRDCDAADEIVRRQLKAVVARIKRLKALQAELKRMITQCSGGKIADCRVIEVLGDSSHAHCLAHRHSAPEPALAGD
jgi:DNA-binding transcriptional MerR regulator